MHDRHIIHIRIRDLRRERELTQEELAEALGISRQSINAMEAGRALPSLPVALQIASFFAVPLHQLIAEQRRQEEAAFTESMPAVNVAESEAEFQVMLALPGFTKDDISLDIGADFLTVRGQVQSEPDNLVHREFHPSAFSRTIRLPSPVEEEGAVAQMRNGILTVRLKKELPKLPKTKRLEISAD